ncbi:hypothetical protein [Micromonospora orduensis]|nr:hypothetical protein [Micromonospora orduensis]
MLIIAGSLRVEPDARDDYLAECDQVIAQARATDVRRYLISGVEAA